VRAIPAECPAVQSGIGLFETMLVASGRVIHLEDHASRMAESCIALQFPPLDEQQFRNAATRAVRVIEDESALRLTRVGVSTHDWPLFATTFPLPAATRSRRENGRAITLHPSMRRALPLHKLTSYAVCALALRDAVNAGADEGLFVSKASAVLEGTATNIFAIRGTKLVTAPLSAGVLPGIVRAWVVASAAVIGLSLEERPPEVSEILEGGFFTGSLTKIAPIRSLDGRPCALPGEAFGELVRRYRLATDMHHQIASGLECP